MTISIYGHLLMAIKLWPADRQFSDAIRLSRHYVCEHCGVQGGKKGGDLPQIECCHIYGRRHAATRWDTLNALAMCHSCHRSFTECPVAFTRFLEEYVGAGYLQILNEKRNGIFKNNKAIRAEITAHYRNEIKLMEAGRHDLISYQ